MPIYEYECEKCHLRFEMKRCFGENGSGFCPQCGSVAQRVFSPVTIIFKGSGFYATDSRKDHDRPPGEASGDRSNDHKESKAN